MCLNSLYTKCVCECLCVCLFYIFSCRKFSLTFFVLHQFHSPSPFIIAYSLCTKFSAMYQDRNFIFCHSNCPFHLSFSLSMCVCAFVSFSLYRFVLCICEMTVRIKTEISIHLSYIDFLSVALEFIFYQKKETFTFSLPSK